MARKRTWETLKREVHQMIKEDKLIGYLDPGIKPILEKLNSIALIATTSSCIGRITIIEGRKPWSRSDSMIIYKTHTSPDPDRIRRVLSRPFKNIWIKATGPILHMRTPRLECASRLLEVFRPYGFKHSGIISLDSRRGYTVELMSGVDVTAPIRMDGIQFIDVDSLVLMARMLYEFIEEARRGLTEAVEEIRSQPGSCEG